MIVQWILFLPLILPITLLAGAIEGVRSAFASVVEQMRMDVSNPQV
jgi:hypothetical protein